MKREPERESAREECAHGIERKNERGREGQRRRTGKERVKLIVALFPLLPRTHIHLSHVT